MSEGRARSQMCWKLQKEKRKNSSITDAEACKHQQQIFFWLISLSLNQADINLETGRSDMNHLGVIINPAKL